jgi:hypothetical protein
LVRNGVAIIQAAQLLKILRIFQIDSNFCKERKQRDGFLKYRALCRPIEPSSGSVPSKVSLIAAARGVSFLGSVRPPGKATCGTKMLHQEGTNGADGGTRCRTWPLQRSRGLMERFMNIISRHGVVLGPSERAGSRVCIRATCVTF